jgi:hypothetical protein
VNFVVEPIGATSAPAKNVHHPQAIIGAFDFRYSWRQIRKRRTLSSLMPHDAKFRQFGCGSHSQTS